MSILWYGIVTYGVETIEVTAMGVANPYYHLVVTVPPLTIQRLGTLVGKSVSIGRCADVIEGDIEKQCSFSSALSADAMALGDRWSFSAV